MKHLYLALVFIFTSLACFAQVTITGRVINQADTKPVADASVFLSNATIGDKTAGDGTFSLKGVKPGRYDLVVSIIGFEAYTQSINVAHENVTLPPVMIFPRSIALNQVTIKADKIDFNRKRNIDWFKDEFLGTTPLAKECKIMNPEMLDLAYDEKTGTLKASSADFLVIVNEALGYKIKYLLNDFTLNNEDEQNKTVSYTGQVLFEKLKGSAGQEKHWQQQRKEIYEGSQAHFLKSVLADRIEQQGFRVLRLPANPERPADSLIDENIKKYQSLKGEPRYHDSLAYWIKKSKLPKRLEKVDPRPLKADDIMAGPIKQGFYALSGNKFTHNADGLFITYNKYRRFNRSPMSKLSDPANTDNTLVVFENGPALFDGNGSLSDPKSVTLTGVWGRNRIAGLLPLDYEPQEDLAGITDSLLVKKISDKLNAYKLNHITEKAYLHFDKPYYAAGDTIYFKAYVTRGEEQQLSGLSGVLTADLIDPGNKVIRSIKLQLTDGVAWGDFALSDSLKQGNYRVRAYTRLAQSEGEGSFFDRNIVVGSSLPGRVPEAAARQLLPKNKPETKFLPEGGTLVTGVRSKIAFKAIGANGQGIAVKGTVVDNENKELTAFASTHLGMGYFYLAPAEDKTYRARLTYADGTQAETELPKSENRGISIEVTDQPRLYTVKISSSKAYYQEHKNKNYTLVTTSGETFSGISHKLDNPEVMLTLYKKDLHTGIARTTLFADNGEPLCERLLFVQNDDPKPQISSDKTVYSKREKVTLTLHAAGGHYSAAVTDEDKLTTDENEELTIINNLLLTSGLRGNIEQPNYYFTNINQKTTADLDLVMLTHGYRRFEWEKVLNGDNTAAAADRPEKGLTIAGRVKAHGRPVAGGKVKLFSKSGGGLMLDTTTDKNGHFEFDNLTFSDSTKFVIQARTAAGIKDVDIEMDKADPSPMVSTRIKDTINNNNSLPAYLQSSKLFKEEQKKYGINQHQALLKEVIIKDKKKNPLLAHSENLNGAGNADQVITAKDLEETGAITLFEALRARAHFINFTSDHKIVSQHAGEKITGGKPEYMEIVVDGIPWQQAELKRGDTPLDELRTDDIESIEIGLGAHYGAIYGSRAAAGVVIITTKKAKKINNYYREAPGVIVYTAKGFYKARAFYSPQYDNPQTNQKIPDLRSTIFWKPDIITDKDGKASFSFFNADGKGTYRVVVEGIDADGNLGRQVYRYRVE